MSSLIAIVTHASPSILTLQECKHGEWWMTPDGQVAMKTLHGKVIVFDPTDKEFFVSQSKPCDWVVTKKMADRIELAW